MSVSSLYLVTCWLISNMSPLPTRVHALPQLSSMPFPLSELFLPMTHFPDLSSSRKTLLSIGVLPRYPPVAQMLCLLLSPWSTCILLLGHVPCCSVMSVCLFPSLHFKLLNCKDYILLNSLVFLVFEKNKIQ